MHSSLIRTAAVVGLTGAIAGDVLAGGLGYTSAEQTLSGAVAVEFFDTEPLTDSSAFSTLLPQNVNETFSIQASEGFSAIAMTGYLSTQLGATGFMIDTAISVDITDPGAFEGTFLGGSYSGEAFVSIAFVVSGPIEVEYSLIASEFAALVRSGDEGNPIALYDENSAGQPALTGTVILEAGEYRMFGGGTISGDDTSGFFDGATVSSAAFSLNVVPAPGAVCWVLGLGGLAASRRR